MTDGYSLSDIATATGNNDGFGGNGAWWIIILFLFCFNGGWNNAGRSGVADNYVLASDFATIQRQISDSTNATERKLDSISNGLCDLGYTQAQLINNNNMAQMQSANAIQSQLASCCCDIREGISNGFANVNYNMAMNSNTLQNAINTGFCQTNYNEQTNTRDIIDSQNANTKAILDAITQNKVEAMQDKIASLTADNQALKFQASQVAQNAYIGHVADNAVQRIVPMPVPSYSVPNPYTGCGCICS